MLQELLICSTDSLVYSKLPLVLLMYPARGSLKWGGALLQVAGLFGGLCWGEQGCVLVKQWEGCWRSSCPLPHLLGALMWKGGSQHPLEQGWAAVAAKGSELLTDVSALEGGRPCQWLPLTLSLMHQLVGDGFAISSWLPVLPSCATKGENGACRVNAALEKPGWGWGSAQWGHGLWGWGRVVGSGLLWGVVGSGNSRAEITES